MPYTTDLDSHYQPALAKGLSFELLNALVPPPCGWQARCAQRRHEDLFGDVVQAGQTYYTRQAGPGYSEVLKLSQASMDRLLVALFFGNDGLHQMVKAEAARREHSSLADMRAAMEAAAQRDRV